ncbi:alpha/beta-hydrolase [Xylariaceae sp. AK1471]|nr:alpha/beta-hydrolase [Xylariaceae sp. AK1471]
MATNVTLHVVAISPLEVERLKRKPDATRLPKETAEDDWSRSPPIKEIRRLAAHWRGAFSWAAFGKKLDKLPNFEATISLDGCEPFQLHFLHQESPDPDAIPLLFIHGWPGSFYEVTKTLPLLAANDPPFHVVAPSLPNFLFSSCIDKPGFGMKQYAETCHKLMLSLNYEQYTAQGGDCGSSISQLMGALYPQSLRALHLNLVSSGLQRAQKFRGGGNGYFEIQKQRPRIIGIALEDSPVAILTRAGPAASAIIYHEAFKGGFSYFPKEIFGTPTLWNWQIGHVAFECEHEREVLVDDICVVFQRGGQAYKSIKKQ